MENSEIECCVVQVVADAERSGGVVFPADLDYAFRCPEGRLDVGCSGCGSFKEGGTEGGRRERKGGIPLLIPLLPSGFGAKLDSVKRSVARPSGLSVLRVTCS